MEIGGMRVSHPQQLSSNGGMSCPSLPEVLWDVENAHARGSVSLIFESDLGPVAEKSAAGAEVAVEQLTGRDLTGGPLVFRFRS